MPQRIINLGEDFEFVSFVHCYRMKDTADCKILMLVKHNSEIRMLMIKFSPWERIETDKPFN